jgi:hypothetical protein
VADLIRMLQSEPATKAEKFAARRECLLVRRSINPRSEKLSCGSVTAHGLIVGELNAPPENSVFAVRLDFSARSTRP